MRLARWNPWEELTLPEWLRPEWLRAEGEWHPAVDVAKADGELVIRAELPGVDPENVDVRVFSDCCQIRGSMDQEAQEEREGYFHRERRTGKFIRQVRLPVEVIPEDARATFKNGLLEIAIPRAQNKGDDEGFKVAVKAG